MAIGFAAAVVSALVAADGRLLRQLHATRAAEAAAEAAGGVAADRMLELRAEAIAERRSIDIIDAVVADPFVATRAGRAAREVLVPLHGTLTRLVIARRADELSAKAEVRAFGADGIARVGVRPP